MAVDARPASGFRMRPLSVGDILDESIQVYRRQFVAFITAAAVVIVPLALLRMALIAGMAILGGSLGSGRISSEMGAAVGIGAALMTLPVTLLTMLGQLLAGVAALKIASDAILGQTVNIWDAYRLALRRFGAVSIAGLLVGLVVSGAALCFPVSIFFAMSWGLVFAVIVMEPVSGTDALRRSWELMRGRRWQLMICYIVISMVVAMLVAIPVTLLAVFAGVGAAIWAESISQVGSGGFVLFQVGQIVLQALGETLFLSISYIVMARFYFDARVRKEAFDIELRLDRQAAAQTAAQVAAQRP
ncbi:MAG: hypothetical protein IT306_15615 [Chloroflexi bacterium]|nr:hypothetical protein [Chloroflexota bacterium]